MNAKAVGVVSPCGVVENGQQVRRNPPYSEEGLEKPVSPSYLMFAITASHRSSFRVTSNGAIGEKPETIMSGKRESHASGRKGGIYRRFRAPLLAGAAAALGVVVAPAVSSAFSSGYDSRPVSLAARGGIGSFTPASVDPRLASQITVRALSGGKLFRFTPAGTDTRPDRAITVAVRVDEQSARAISIRSILASAANAPGASPERIAPMVFNLGLARGYQSFAPAVSPPQDIQRIDMPDLASYKTPRTPSSPGRFSPRIALDDKDRAGRTPRTLEGQDEYQVDVGGSYRLTRNLDVTAGVRYTSERDRLRPLTDGKQDSQAVYVGTQFRF